MSNENRVQAEKKERSEVSEVCETADTGLTAKSRTELCTLYPREYYSLLYPNNFIYEVYWLYIRSGGDHSCNSALGSGLFK